LSISGFIGDRLAAAAGRLAAAVLPQHCLLCAAPAGAGPLCPACRDTLPALPSPRCPVCAAPSPGGTSCGTCLKEVPHFDLSIAAYRYTYPVDKLVQALKYQHRLPLADFFAEILLQGARPAGDAIVPLPLSPQRLRERGFNQAVEIARPLARRLGLPLLTGIVSRPQDMPPQATLPWQARRKNVRGCFLGTTDLSGRALIVVDDVMTTGATLDEFARTLKKHGAARVSNWVLARALKE